MRANSISELAIELLTRRSYPNYEEVLECIQKEFSGKTFLSVYFRERRDSIFKKRPGDTSGAFLYFNYLSFRMLKGQLSRFQDRNDVAEGHSIDASGNFQSRQFHNIVMFCSNDFDEANLRNIASLLFNFYVVSDVRDQYYHNATERLIRTRKLDFFKLGQIVEGVKRTFKIDAFYFAVKRPNSQDVTFSKDTDGEFDLVVQHGLIDAALVETQSLYDPVRRSLRYNQHRSGRFKTPNGYTYYKVIPVHHYYEGSPQSDSTKQRGSPLGFQIKRRPLGCLVLASEKEISRLCYSFTRELLSEYSGSQNLVTKLSILNSLARERAEIQLVLQTAPLKTASEYNNKVSRFADRIAHSLAHITEARTVAIRLLNPFTDSLELLSCWPRGKSQRDPVFREAIRVRTGECSLNGFVFHSLAQGEHAYIANLKASSLPDTLVSRGLRKMLPAGDGMRSELCIPIFKSGLCFGTIDLESEFEQAFDMNVQFCHQLAELLGGFLEIVDRSSDAGWLPRLSFFQYAAHRIEQARREINRDKKVSLETLLNFIEDRLSPNYIAPHNTRKLETSLFFASVERFIATLDDSGSRNPTFFSVFGEYPTLIPAKVAHSLQVILENIIENAGEHDGFSGQLILRFQGGSSSKARKNRRPLLQIEYQAKKARFNVRRLSEVGIAPRWNSSEAGYHLGMFLVGVHVRLLGGTMWIDRFAPPNAPAPSFHMIVHLPLPES